MIGSPLLLALVCAITYYAAGAHEARDGRRNPGPLWALASVGVSAVALALLGFGWTGLLICQVLLFFVIGAVRAWREP
ncbi:MAG: hypothetical protein ACREO3_01550 [Arenimonas sp.]